MVLAILVVLVEVIFYSSIGSLILEVLVELNHHPSNNLVIFDAFYVNKVLRLYVVFYRGVLTDN